MDGDDVAMLDTQVVAHNAIQAAAAVIEIIITEHDQNSIFSLFAANEDSITTEQLEGIHGVVGQSNNGVVIVDGIGDPIILVSLSFQGAMTSVFLIAYINWLGFFFFLRMAVAVSSSSLCSLPEASL